MEEQIVKMTLVLEVKLQNITEIFVNNETK